MRTEHTRIGPAERLAAELEDFATDRDSHGKHERATAARAAAVQLLAGHGVLFERVYYAPSVDLDRYSARVGTRDEVIAELHDASDGFAHLGKDTLAFKARAAAAMILAGTSRHVRVGHLAWRVDDGA